MASLKLVHNLHSFLISNGLGLSDNFCVTSVRFQLLNEAFRFPHFIRFISVYSYIRELHTGGQPLVMYKTLADLSDTKVGYLSSFNDYL